MKATVYEQITLYVYYIVAYYENENELLLIIIN